MWKQQQLFWWTVAVLFLTGTTTPPLRTLIGVAVAADVTPKPTTTTKKKKKKILSFGGNGMIGSHVLERLLSSSEKGLGGGGEHDEYEYEFEYEITLVARGNWDYKMDETILPFVNFIQCDRGALHADDDDDDSVFQEADDDDSTKKSNALRTNCPELLQDIQETTEYYAVLDFSGYQPQWIRDALQVLDNKARVYIFVSTDSVYEVCQPAASAAATVRQLGGGGAAGERTVGPPPHGHTKTLETQAVRPEDPHIRQWLNERDGYGNKKLACEELLQNQQQQQHRKKIPYVSLRFADVVGPRDFSLRFWKLYNLVKFYHVLGLGPIRVPAHLVHLQSSITYVGDAASAVIASMHCELDCWNEAYNIASEEVFTITSAVHLLAELLHIDDIETQIWDDDEREGEVDEESSSLYVADSYPSVQSGPIDINKARKRLGFQPTPLKEVFLKTIKWYENGDEVSNDQWEQLLINFLEEVMEDKDEEDVADAFRAILASEQEGGGKDEL